MSVVTVERENGIAIVTINNPPLNVFSKQVAKELSEIYEELEKDWRITVIILTGAGQKAFMAGADIKEFPQMIGNPDMESHIKRTHRIFHQLSAIPKPVIAVLNGMTFGGGCELALTADIRLAEEHAQIGLPEIKLGLFPGGGGTQRLPRLIGPSKAKELMFLGEPISAEEAKEIQLVNRVVPSGEGLAEAKKLAKKMNSYSLQSLSRIKQAVDEGLNESLEDGIELEAKLFYDIFQTGDIQEGVQAFIEKRKPVFNHK
ncbi:enoyl-CoA hydratase/carnithine racemase [Bacillus ectoiniformans]|uniref:enoyl-CoA hydratase n=1 Tax=Bacillus ectoiniformans TaxID=1494429 RepID=UPI001959FCA8|nr:enoyl-CoA hydratase [Bacillus ectoiniformans]MBM7647700.1 enoyl-CoA hydratase/carnithine racemase [Bacillus ectoiniformans]